jgi:hypothetical protein
MNLKLFQLDGSHHHEINEILIGSRGWHANVTVPRLPEAFASMTFHNRFFLSQRH